MIYAGILAGGIGQRMQRLDIPKQFLMLGSKPIIIHTIEQFIINNYVDEVIVAAPKDWILYTQNLIKKNIFVKTDITVIAGGSDKNKSLMNIINFINDRSGIVHDDIIVSHDAIRPFVNQRIINENIEQAKKYFAVNTVISPVDTIVESLDGKEISNFPPKRNLYLEQTPQTFNLKKLKEVYEEFDGRKENIFGDTAKMFAESGHSIFLVKGDHSNMKIITPFDLKVANSLLKAEKND
jgi:D-ribitol-5-phosphate cytidylyltransferase